MNKDQTHHNTTWDFNGHHGVDRTSNFYSQADWNSTLVTKVNIISSMIHRESHRSGADTIEVSPKMMSIIGSMIMFNANDYTLGGKYNVIVDESIEENTIYVYSKSQLDHLIAIPFITSTQIEKESNINEKTFIKKKTKEVEMDFENEMKTITLKLAQQCTEEEISSRRRKLAGYIDVENF